MKINNKKIAELADNCYKKPDKSKSPINEILKSAYAGEIKFLESSGNGSDKNGFFAYAVKHEDEIYIVTRGTEPDLIAELSELPVHHHADKAFTAYRGTYGSDLSIWRGETPKQYERSAKHFYKKIITENPEAKIHFVGHSLGGALSAIAAAEFNLPAIAFDSPGTKDIIQAKFGGEKASSVQITNFLTAPNYINTSGSHLGQIIKLPALLPAAEVIKAHEEFSSINIFAYSRALHGMSNIVELFDNDGSHGGIPVSAWPRGIAEAVAFFESKDLNGEFHNLTTKIIWDNNLQIRIEEFDIVHGQDLNLKIPVQSKYTSYQEFLESTNKLLATRPELLIKFAEHTSSTSITNTAANLEAQSIDFASRMNKQLKDKIDNNIKLSIHERIYGIEIAKKYFSDLKASNVFGSDYNYSFVSGEGDIGRISNSILFRQAAIDGVDNISEKASQVKFLLAYLHINEVGNSAIGGISLEQSMQIREKAFSSQGLSPYSDFCKLVATISSPGTSHDFKQISDLSGLLQKVINPTVNQLSISTSNVINLPQEISGLLTHRAVSALKDGLHASIDPNLVKVALGPIAGSSKEEVARSFGVPVAQVKAKFTDKSTPQSFVSTNVDKIFEVVPPRTHSQPYLQSVVFKAQDLSAFTPRLNALEKIDPEFVTRLMVSPTVLKQNAILTGTSLDIAALTRTVAASPAIDNSMLQVTISRSFEEAHRNKDMTESWKTGTAIYGSQYEVNMPINVLNGNGAKNVWPSSIVTDSYRPGAHQISDFNTPEQIKSVVHKPDISTVKKAAMMNNCQTSSLSKLNVDPIIIDITGNGIELTNYNDNNVLFDIDGDGFLEETGWVGSNTGILVIDKKGTGIISNIREMVSEKLDGIEAKDGFEALRRYDLNNDGVIDKNDPIFDELRVWVNKASDGVTKPGELIKLSDLGIKSIIIGQNHIIECQEEVANNIVKAKSYCLLENGEKREVASVDFTANPSGHKYEETEEGIVVVSESGTKSYTSKSKVSIQLDAEKLGVNNLHASEKGDVLIGNDNDNWLISGGGSNIYIGKKGDNTLIITAKDELKNIKAGNGFNTVVITGDEGMYFNLNQTGAHVITGGHGGDIIDASDCSYNAFIQAGDGDNLIIGGIADCALSGGRGDDIIVGGKGNSLIRGHNGNNLIIGGLGDNYLESGDGFNMLIGGAGKNVFAINGSGYTIFDGTKGQHNIAKFSGNLSEYKFERKENGDLVVKDMRKGIDSVSVLKNIHVMDFKNIDNISETTILAATSYIAVEEQPKETTITAEQLIANHSQFTKTHLYVAQISDVKGGTVKIEYVSEKIVKKIVFMPDENYDGLMSFSYIPVDERGGVSITAITSINEYNGLCANTKSMVFFKKPSYPVDHLFYHQYYLSENRIFPLWQEYTGRGVKVAIVETGTFDAEHPDLKSNSLIINRDQSTITKHATMVAGVIAAAINDYGSVGVAPEAKLTSRIATLSSKNEFTPVVPLVDIINFSCEWPFLGENPGNVISYYGESGINECYDFIYVKGIQEKIISGRNDLGTIFVAAAGNSKALNGDTNYCLLKSNPYLITVGGVDKVTDLGLGEAPYKSFSNPGSNILVSAPCYHIFSTSFKLCNSYNSVFGSESEFDSGSSLAAPIISGIVALMLQANPYLGVIDVQNILAYSARMFKTINGEEWLFNSAKNYNGGGLHFHYNYGFGNIDALTAVRLAETWVSQNKTFSTIDVPLLTAGNNLFTSVNNTTLSHITRTLGYYDRDSKFIIDKVILYIEGNNIQLDKLNINIESTDVTMTSTTFEVGEKTISTLIGAKKTLDSEKNNYKLTSKDNGDHNKIFSPLTNHFLGMTTKGVWKIDLRYGDLVKEDTDFSSIYLTFYGKTANNNTYVFTDEAASLFNAKRAIIDCPEGFNTINVAAVGSASQIDLQNKSLKIMNNNYTVTAKSKVHNVFGGDRNDVIIGNELDNILVGGRGNNVIKGISGHNIICGGKGNNDLYSGNDADMFVIKNIPSSHNRIFNFKPNLPKEVINIVGFNTFKSFSDLVFEQINTDLVINLGSQKLVLTNMTREKLKEDNFVFDDHFNFHSQFTGDHMEWNSSLQHAIYHL